MQGTHEDRSLAAIGRRLLATRTAIGLNQRQFAQRAKVAPNTYNQWERGSSRPRLDEAIRLVDEYDITLDWIYLGDQRRLAYELIDALRQSGSIRRP